MKTNFLRLFALLLTVLMLVGCGEQAQDQSAGGDEKTETKTATKKKVYCMTGFSVLENEQERAYTVTYEEEGVRLEPQTLSSEDRNEVYLYSWDGRLLWQKQIEEDGTVIYAKEYDYDASGNLTEQRSITKAGKVSRMVCTYNEQGKLSARNHYSTDGELSELETYTYDAKGFLTEYTRKDGDGNRISRDLYTCNQAGNVTFCQYYVYRNERESLLSDRLYTYDAAGRLLSIQWDPHYEDDYLRESKYFTYDENGRMIEYRLFHQETDQILTQSFQYDEAGYLVNIGTHKIDHYKVFSYQEQEMDADMAENARLWSTSGAIKANIPVADPIHS